MTTATLHNCPVESATLLAVQDELAEQRRITEELRETLEALQQEVNRLQAAAAQEGSDNYKDRALTSTLRPILRTLSNGLLMGGVFYLDWTFSNGQLTSFGLPLAICLYELTQVIRAWNESPQNHTQADLLAIKQWLKRFGHNFRYLNRGQPTSTL